MFHSFWHSGATFAYNSHIPIGDIKHHGSWALDCVWMYIQRGHKKGEDIVRRFADVLT